MAILVIAVADEYEELQEKSWNDDHEKQTKEDTEILPGKNKGWCRLDVGTWKKPGTVLRCNCLKCVCKDAGAWVCVFNKAFCPYFHCGHQIFNPNSQICCYGNVYAKKKGFACCGLYYYNAAIAKCCPHFSVKPKSVDCEKSKV